MSNDIKDTGKAQRDVTDTNLNVTYTQIASCAVPNYTSAPMRRGLRAKLESEREKRELKRQNNLINKLRNLFSPTTS